MTTLSTGQRVAGRYRVLGPLGAGSQGTVWEVADEAEGDAVRAMKVVPEAVSRDELELRFGVEHASLVTTLDGGRLDDGAGFVVMPRVEGVTLDRVGDARAVASAIGDVAEALDALHRAGFVHGDVKPENVVAGDARAVLLDLGFARRRGVSAELSGTLAYMAPERVVGERAPAADLFALGVTAAVTLGGGHPFVEHHDDPRAVLEALSRRAPVRREVMERVDPTLRALVEELLRHDPARRPRSAAAWAARWRRALSPGEPVALVAPPDAVPPRPAWIGRDEDRDAVVRDTLRALDGALVGVVVVGAPGSGRGRLLDEALRDVRLEMVRRDVELDLRDALPEECARPTLVVLRDATPEGLHELAARVSSMRRFAPGIAPVALLATAPESPEGDGLAAVNLSPLDRARTQELLETLHGARLPRTVVDVWMEVTAGLPGRVVTLARLVGPAAIPAATRSSLAACAATLHDGRAPAHLAPAERALLTALQVVDAPLDVGLLARWPDLASSLSALERAGLVVVRDGAAQALAGRPGDDPDLAAVGAALSALLTEVAPSRRVARARAARAAGDDRAAYALYLAAVDDPATPRAQAEALLRESSDLAAAPAAHRLRRARVLVAVGRPEDALDALAPDDRSTDATALRVDALRRTGHRDEALALLDAMTDPAGQRLRALVLAREHIDRGDLDAARALLDRGLAEGDGVPDALRPRALEVGALLALCDDSLDLAASRVERALALALDARDDLGRARLCSLAGMIAQRRGRHLDARRWYHDAWSLASREGDLHAAATYQVNLAGASLECGALGDALQWLQRAAQQLARLRRMPELARALTNLASLLAWVGDRAGAADVARRAVDASRIVRDAVSESLARSVEADMSASPSLAVEGMLSAAAQAEAVDRVRAAEIRARAVARLVGAGDIARAEAVLTQLGAAGTALGALAALAVAVAAKRPMEAQRALLDACRDAVRDDPSVEHELWWLRLLAERAEQSGDGAAARAARAVYTARRDALGATLPDALAPLFAEAHRFDAPPDVAPVHRDEDIPRWRRLMSIIQGLNSEMRLRPLLERVMDAIIELTGASRGFLLLREEGGALTLRTARNLGARDLDRDDMAFSRTLAESVARDGAAVVSVDATSDQRFDAVESVAAMRLRSVLAVPLRVHGEVVGTVYVDDRFRAGAFGERDLELATTFADAAAVAIHNASQRNALRRALRRAEQLSEALARQLATQRVELEVARQAVDPDATRGRYDEIVGRGPAMQKSLALVDRVAPSAMSVLLAGESGTGKELVARAIHRNSPRNGRPFVAENCGAIPETLLESVLFGHEKGAFTGADRTRPGLFEVADGGTLFLDEIGEMSPRMQAQLLRVLQDGEIRRVGSERPRKVDVRVIAATHRDLAEMVRRGTFREDLFYRVAVVVLPVPALRERREDIPALVSHFLQKYGAPGMAIDRQAMSRLVTAPWPGNVRQLQNEIQRAAVMAQDVIREEDLSPDLAPPRAGDARREAPQSALDIRHAVEDVERDLVARALMEHEGNQSRAAKALGLSRFGLQKKLKRLGLSVREIVRRSGRPS